MKIFIYREKAAQMENWPDSRISMNIRVIVLYCIVYFYYRDMYKLIKMTA